ncbi:hypothetical protein Vretimale_7462 [Volvox reticuliferus]|uniref:Uncharacterized protein n=1 Tax=Volvox reticuliferus TaxID=1737510 RepID=A0A8J4G9I9_9CHLO|nr:hypothetical protein Vretimale_7462 [Volvox reticuliferus]
MQSAWRVMVEEAATSGGTRWREKPGCGRQLELPQYDKAERRYGMAQRTVLAVLSFALHRRVFLGPEHPARRTRMGHVRQDPGPQICRTRTAAWHQVKLVHNIIINTSECRTFYNRPVQEPVICVATAADDKAIGKPPYSSHLAAGRPGRGERAATLLAAAQG